jgi:2-iminobutanoate/2-iminopropanoate deaminase
MKKQAVTVANGPSAIGPYSVGIQAGEFVFTAGQIGLDPATGNIVSGGVEAETRQALENLKKILEAAHSGLDEVVKTTVFLQNMGDFAAMNAIYAQYFAEPYPARSAIQVAALPKNAQVEIEAVAITH